MKTCLLSAALLLLAVRPGWADNLIVNGSFESYDPSAGIDYGSYIRFFSPPPNTGITGWIITGSSGGNPNNVDLAHSFLWPAFDGNESLDMEGAEGASGVICQSFATTPGTTYTLSFAYGNNPGDSGATMNVLVMGADVLLDQDVSHNTSTFADMDYTLFSADFTADADSATLQFSALTNSGYGIVLDAVSVEEGGGG
ncbi:MAG TPA: DUF642 domain-containing protein [Gemmataceae bacterium]|nr:DUF642 domain-containing protein [Gemmataceae bacterium]